MMRRVMCRENKTSEEEEEEMKRKRACRERGNKKISGTLGRRRRRITRTRKMRKINKKCSIKSV